MNLSEIQIDYIKELFNVGLGEAAAELSEMVNEEVYMSVPQFELFQREKIYDYLEIGRDQQVTCIIQPIVGTLKGNGVLLFPAAESLGLVRTILEESGSTEELSMLEVESLKEISSIILEQVLTTIGELLSVTIGTELPKSCQGEFQEIIERFYQGDTVMFVGMDFAIKNSALKGDILFLQDVQVIEDFLQQTNRALEELGL